MTNASAENETIVDLTDQTVGLWVDGYLKAWASNDPADIAALFTEDASYLESPYATEWIGREEIVDGGRSRRDWQPGGWDFEWTLKSVSGRVVEITGIGRYKKLGEFDNAWTVTFDTSGRATKSAMINSERA